MLSIVDWFGYDLPTAERFRLIREAGFDAVMLLWSDEFEGAEFRSQPEWARAAGLEVENVHAPFRGCNALWTDGVEGDMWLSELVGCVEDCGAFGIGTMVLHLTEGKAPPLPNDMGAARVWQLAEVAEQCGVNVALENVQVTSPHLEYVLKRVDSPRIGFCYDSGHDRCYGAGMDLMEAFGARLMALHLHDNDGTKDSHWLPFDGVVDWADVMKRVSAAGYTGAVALESYAHVGGMMASAQVFLAAAYERGIQLEKMRRGCDGGSTK